MTYLAAYAGLALVGLAACGADARAGRPRADNVGRSAAVQDAEVLGRDIFEMVDRAVDYRGSHRSQPAASFKQMGIDSLTPTVIRRMATVDREPVVTVAFRRPDGHEIISCRADSRILEEAAVGGGRFTLLCTTRSGEERPIEVESDSRTGESSP